MGNFACCLSWALFVGIFRLETPAFDLSLGKCRLMTSVQDPSTGNLELGYFAWELSLGNFRSITVTLDISLGIFHLGYLAWDLWLGILAFGALA